MIPQTYEQWRHCIIVECGIELTPSYLAERRQTWGNEAAEETQRFRRLYGDRHWLAVRGWFEQAARDAAG